MKRDIIMCNKPWKLRARVFDVPDIEIRHTTLFECFSQP